MSSARPADEPRDEPAAEPSAEPSRPGQDWRILVGVFWVTSLVEGLGVSQIFALLPTYLRQMGVAEADRLAFIGLFSALIFVVGMPLVPLWGVWADKYSRKVVIARSAIVEAVVFAGVALSREPWQLAVSMLLIGLQLGNTGVMLAGIRDVTPRARLGTTISIFGASGPIGFAVGPALAGLLIDGAGWSVSSVFWLSAVLSIGTAMLVGFGSGAIRAVISDPAVRRVFIIFGLSFLASQMTRPFQPVLVEHLVGTGPGLASSIALVMGTAALAGALVSPAGGMLSDRIGFRPILTAALAGAGAVLLLMPLVSSLFALAGLAVVLAAATSTVNAMVFGVLATEVPPERRSTTLNLVYLPLYGAGVVGPAIGGGIASAGGAAAPFAVAGLGLLAGALAIWSRRRRSTIEVNPGAAPSGMDLPG